MNRERYNEIKSYLRHLIKGTEWEGNIYAVGGCVRDDIMGAEVNDVDMCVTIPSGGIRFAEWLHDSGYTLFDVVVYPQYGTAMLKLAAFPDEELEFVQTRKEKYPNAASRNPETVFGTIEEDCMRRDLTINALYCNISSNEIVDVTGTSLYDIEHKVIRTPNDPDITYDDDPLRILRCIRFTSRFGWDIEENTFNGMLRNVHRLSIIARERVKDELNKMLVSANPVMAMELLRTTGAMHYVIPQLEETYAMEQNEYHFGTVWEHTLAVLNNMGSKRLELRMAALLHDIGKIRVRSVENGKVHFLRHDEASADMVDDILRPLRYSNDFIDDVTFFVRHHMDTKTWGGECEAMKLKRLRKLQYVCKTEERFRDLMTLIDADNKAHAEEHCMPHQAEIILERTEKMKAEGSAMFGYKLPLSGKEIMELKGMKSGPEVKECLEYLLKLALVNPLRDREEFVKHVRGYRIENQQNCDGRKR